MTTNAAQFWGNAKSEDQQRLAGATLMAQQTTPDQQAEVIDLSQRSGIPPAVVATDPDTVRQDVQRQQVDTLAQQSPAVAQWLTAKPEHLALASDDLGTLGKLGQLLPAIGKSSPLDMLKEFNRQGTQALGQGIAGLGDLLDAFAYGATRTVQGEQAADQYMREAAHSSTNPAQWLRSAGEFVGQGSLLGKLAPGLYTELPEDHQDLMTDLAGGLGQIISQATVSRINPTAGGALLFGQGAEQMAEQVRQTGKEGTAEGHEAVVGGAAITGVLEKFGLDRLMHRLPPGVRNPLLRKLADVAIGGGIEAGEETAENLAQDALTQALLDPDWRIGEGIARQAEAAGATGAVARAVIGLATGRRTRMQAQAERAHVDGLVDAVAESPLKRRAPEALADLIETAQPGEHVYVPLQALQSHYGPRTEQAVLALTGDEVAYAEAKETGTEVQIPLSRYVATISPEAHAAMAEQLRLQPGEEIKPSTPAPTAVEVKAQLAAAMEEMQAADAQATGAEATGEPVAATHAPLVTDPALMEANTWAEYQQTVQSARDARLEAQEAERQAQAERAQARLQSRERAGIQAEVEAQISQQPAYKAQAILRGRDGIKLDAAAVHAGYGEAGAERLKGLTRKAGGLHPDEAAALLGYRSGGQLMHDLLTAPPLAEVVRTETDARLAAREQDLQETPRHDGLDGVAAMMLKEVQTLEQRTGGRIRTHDAVLRETASQLIARKQVSNVRPHLYRLAEAQAAREAYAAAAKGDWKAAAAARRRQLQNLYLYREARNARDQATRAGRYLGQFLRKPTRAALGQAGGDYLEQIDGLLQRFDFGPVTRAQDASRASLAEWIKGKAEQGILVDVPLDIANEAFRVPFRRLKVGELRDLHAAVRSIAHAAQEANVLRLGEQTRERAVVDQAMAQSVAAAHKERPASSGDRRFGDKTREELLKARIVTGAATDIARELDGFKDLGGVWENTVGVIRSAQDQTNIELEKAATALAELKLKHYTRAELRRMLTEKTFFPEIGDAWSKARILSLALNWGNAGNREAILTQARWRLSTEQVGRLLGELDARDWAFVQGVWQQIDGYWPQIAAAQRRRKGLAPAKVEASPFTVRTRDGKQLTLPGGYFPLKFENDSVRSVREQADDYFDAIRTGRFSKAATKDGFAIERVGSGGRTVRLDLDVVDSHLRDVVRDLHLGDAVNYVHQALKGPEFGRAVDATGTQQLVKGLDTWLRDVASGEMGLRSFGERAARFIRVNSTAAVLTWRLSSAVLQVTGVVQSSVVVGQGAMLDAVARFTRRPRTLRRYVLEASPFMRKRVQTHVEAVEQVVSAQAGKFTRTRAEMIRRGYWMIGQVQSLVDITTWLAAEKQGMGKFDGDVAKARRYADDVVSRTQGSGEFIDKTALQRGTLGDNVRQSEYLRATTTLMGYLIAKQNIGYEVVKTANLRSVRSAGRMATQLALLLVVEDMLGRLLRGQLPKDEENDGSVVDDWIKAAGSAALSNLFGAVPGLSQGVSEMRGYADRSVVADAWHSAAEAMTQAQQGKADKGALKASVKLAGFLTGLPSAQVNKTIDAVAASQDGREVSPYEYLEGPEKKGWGR
ncbi:MAG: hypothetical protein QM601_06260 [Pseudoxanthomonas sp.]